MADERSIEKPPTPIDDKTIKENFGKNLSELRKKSGLSRKQLAGILGLSEITVGSYERGLRQPTFETLFRLADYFNVSLDELIGHVDATQYENAIQTYRLNNAVELLESVGKIIVASSGVYALTVDNKDDDFQTDADGNVKSVGKSKDCITFGGEKDLIDFAEYVQREATFSDKTFYEVFFEKAEKLFTDAESIHAATKILIQNIWHGHIILPTRLKNKKNES